MPATITLADVHGSIETYEVENSLFMQIWDLLHVQANKVDKLRLPEVMVVKHKPNGYGRPAYVRPSAFKVADDSGLQVRSTLDEFITPTSYDQELPATTVVPEVEANPVELHTQSEDNKPNGFYGNSDDFIAELAKLMSKTK